MSRLSCLKLTLICTYLASAATVYSQEVGIASMYADQEKNKVTGSGELYNPNALTAAHKIHPFGTRIRVTRTDETSRRSVVVTVNDRGPYVGGQIVQLSKAAGRRIGLLNPGDTARIVLEVVPRSNAPAVVQTSNPQPDPVTPPASTSPGGTPAIVNTAPPATVAQPKEQLPSSTPAQPTKEPAPAPTAYEQPSGPNQSDEAAMPLVRKDFKTFGLYKIALHNAPNQGFGVQVISLTKPENLLKQIAELQSKWLDNILVSVEPGSDAKMPVYKMILGPFKTEEQARTYAANLKKKYKMSGFVINLNTIQY